MFAVFSLGALGMGVVAGLAIAGIQNVRSIDLLEQQRSALPSQILDRNGRLITEFFSDENRQLVAVEELPRHLLYALITREDQTFFQHRGFSFRGTARAAWNLITSRYVSGGSTITQQLAGHLFDDRNEFSIQRKLRELWWALQIERHWSKYEILEAYLNRMWFGHGTYGVEAASQFFFGHSARELTVAESAMLVIQLANPSLYSPIRRPNEARVMQRAILDQMVRLGYATQDEVDLSFERYWNNYDFSRSNTTTAFFEREDRAPYFSEFIRFELENRLLLGTLDINKDGFVVHTTLDLDFQAAADRYMRSGIARANSVYQRNTATRANYGDQLVPLIDLLSITFNLEDMRIADAKQRQSARQVYQNNINHIVDIVGLMFGDMDPNDGLRYAGRVSRSIQATQSLRTTVEGALISLENDTGHVVAMVGGSSFERINQFNRAVNAALEPGSSFKPLYYAAGIETRAITPASMFYDSPTVFRTDDGAPYTPTNYRGEWMGPVLVRYALSRSMNVPSLKVLDRVGFDAALGISARLLGIPEQQMAARNFVRRYPVGLGIVQVAPIEMARAFATFANQGRRVDPIAIRYIEDRNRRIILEPEADLRRAQQREGNARQIISPQTAYVMTDMLQSAIQEGTLRYAASVVGGFNQPTAGKTGTTQNWADAWTVGYTPYYTTAVWFGFDRGAGNSLGVNQTGAVTAGPVWAEFMHDIHQGLPRREFVRPEGVVTATVSARSGLLPPANYSGRTIEEVFIAGTQPTTFDTLQEFNQEQNAVLVDRLRRNLEHAAFSLESDAFSGIDTGRFDLSVSAPSSGNGSFRLDGFGRDDNFMLEGSTLQNPSFNLDLEAPEFDVPPDQRDAEDTSIPEVLVPADTTNPLLD